MFVEVLFDFGYVLEDSTGEVNFRSGRPNGAVEH